MSISSMIDTIRKRPGMFLGSNSISALWHFLNGYQEAEREYASSSEKELFPLPFRYMHEYACYRLRKHSNRVWCQQILNACDGAEEEALQKFFEFYDEFRQIRMKRYWKAVLSEKNIAWNNEMKRAYRCSSSNLNAREPIYSNPLAVYVIELTISSCILAVETTADIQLGSRFFTSSEKAKGKDLFPEGAEVYFGPIDFWEEFTTPNITFDKNIVL